MDFSFIITKLTDLSISMGNVGIFLFLVIEYAGIPIPSELILPFFGIAAAKGDISLIGIIVLSTLGALIGSLICYGIGFFGGKRLIDFLITKFPRLKKPLNSIEIWFSKYGKESILIVRLLPVIRTYISLFAGAERQKISVFTVYSTIGIAIWNIILILLGYFVGNNMSLIQSILEKYTYASIALVVVGAGIYFYNKKRKSKNEDKELC